MEVQNIGVAVECFHSEQIIGSTSGMKLCSHYCLTHSSVISIYIEKYMKVNKNEVYGNNDDFSKFEQSFTAYLLHYDLVFKIYENGMNNQSPGKLKKFNINPVAFQSFYQLISKEKWNFDKKTSGIKENCSLQAIILSSFILIENVSGKNYLNCLEIFKESTRPGWPVTGKGILVSSCPFGGSAPAVFLHSISRGLVGSISSDGQTFLSDARVSVGCEGAPVYFTNGRKELYLCGMVISPFCWLRGEWIGLSFVAAILPLLQCLLSASSGNNENMNKCISHSVIPSTELYGFSSYHNNIPKIVELMRQCTVRIRTEDKKSFGTGIVVKGFLGIILTCAHVVHNFKYVNVTLADNKIERGEVLFRSTPNSIYNNNYFVKDIAIIQVSPQSYSIPLSRSLPGTGSLLLMGGFSFFDEKVFPSPTFCIGNLAKIYRASATEEVIMVKESCWNTSDNLKDLKFEDNRNRQKNEFPYLLQTTCPAYAGSSGAPVVAVHPTEGPLVVGIISCCTVVNTGASLPHVSFAIPTSLVTQAIDQYILKEDKNEFNLLESKYTSDCNKFNWKEQISAKL